MEIDGRIENAFVNAPRLQILKCHGMQKLGGFDFRSLTPSEKPSQLNKLSISNVREMSLNQLFSKRFDLSRLLDLDLTINIADQSFSAQVFQQILKCTRLVSLKVAAPHGISTPVIADMPQLSCIHLTSKTLRTITVSNLPKLTNISLRHCDGFTGIIFQKNAKLPALLLADLRSTGINSTACLNVINNCPQLTCLRVEQCKSVTEPFKKLVTKANQQGDFAIVQDKGPSIAAKKKKKKKHAFEDDFDDDAYLTTSVFYEEL
jgi:hypothetical protein